MIESVTLAGVLPTVIVARENVAAAPVGKPEAVNETGLGNVTFVGATVRTKFADCPAVTEVGVAGALTE